MFSDDSQAEWREPRKNYGNYPQTTPESLSSLVLNPLVAITLTSEKGITLFPFSDILKPVHGYFVRGYFSDLFGLNLLQANTFSIFWTSLHEHEESSLVLGPTFSTKIEFRFGPFVSSLMAPESIAHSTFGLVGYWLRAHSGSRNQC